jgi:hypothetical protein
MVAGLDGHRHTDVLPPVQPRAHRQDDALLGRGVVATGRDDESGAANPVLVELLDHDAVEERPELVADRVERAGSGAGAHAPRVAAHSATAGADDRSPRLRRMSERIDPGPALAAAGALMVLVSLFLDWYEPDLSGWTSFEIVDLLLAAISAAVIAAAVSRLTRTTDRRPLIRDAWLPVLAATALLLVAVSLVNHPPATVNLGEKAGIWIALAGSLLMLLGSLAGRARISLSFSVREPEPGRPAEPPPARGPDPAPPPAGDTGTQRLGGRQDL